MRLGFNLGFNMMKMIVWQRFAAFLIVLSLLVPAPILANSREGKKNFREGQKYETLRQWDLAAQQYALAVAAEPNNPEYKLRYLRSLQQASLMFVRSGDTLAEQGDYASAYSAYRQAFSYDPGNELAKLKMERVLDTQKNQATGGDTSITNKIGNVFPTSNEIQFARRERPREPAQTISFKETKFKSVVSNLGRQLDLNVVFDESVKDSPVTIELNEVTMAKALDIILKIYKYSFEQVDNRTILVYADNATNRPRFETLMVKTFYLGNLTSQQARTALTALLPAGRQIASLDQPNAPGGNMMIVKATATELQLVQDILANLDKNKNEVVLDVEIYEVSHDSLLQLGNQIVSTALNVTETRLDSTGKPVDYPLGSTASLNNLGGVGRANAGKIVGNSFTPFLSGIGTLIGLPPTQLSLLQSRGDAKLLNRAQVHVIDGQKNQTKVGRSVPVRLGTTYGFGGGGAGTGGLTGGGAGNGAIGGGFGSAGGFGFPGIDSIQYRDVGLVIEAKPTVTNAGYVEIEMKFETSDIVSSGSDATNLTPSFTQRSLNTTARIQDGVTAVVAGINTESNGNSRASIPILGMIPILGRFITTPRQDGRQSDLIITVTPHIVRSQGIDGDDHLAKFAGQAQAGPTPSVEDVVFRAQLVEERERRMIAQQPLQGPPSGQGGQGAPAPVSGPPAPGQPVPASMTGVANPATVQTPNPPISMANPRTQAGTQVQPVANPAPARPRPRIINDQVIANSGIVPNSVSASASGGDSGRSSQRNLPQPYPAPNLAPDPVVINPLPETRVPNQSAPQGSATPAGRPAELDGRELVRAPTGGAPAGDAQAAPGGAGKPAGEAGAASGESDQEESTLVERPPNPVQPAVLRTVRRPEHVERAIAQARAEAERRRREMKANPQPEPPPQMPAEFTKPVQPGKVAPAITTMGAVSASTAGPTLRLDPQSVSSAVGNTLRINIEANSQKSVTLSTLALKFDSARLSVRNVTAGEMLGPNPAFTFKVENGFLIVQFNPSPASVPTGKGRLLSVEFSATAGGQSEVTVETRVSLFRDVQNARLQLKPASARIVISQDGQASVPNEK